MPTCAERSAPAPGALRALTALLAVAAVLAGCATGSPVDRPGGSPVADDATIEPSEPAPASPRPSVAGDLECFGSDDPAACVPRDSLPAGWSLETQDLVMAYGGRLHEALGNNEDLLAFTWEPLTIEVFWPEPLPASLDGLIAEAAADGITIVWREIAMSQAEAQALVMRLADGLTAAGVEWTSIGPERGYGALIVGTPEPLDAIEEGRIRQIAAEVVPGMEIRFEVQEPAVPLVVEVEQP